ncbi:MAG: hypothetical protein KJ645_02260 [Planctomycetes bacterium]|nr:hypothetical protein [Planctomycetota bacterium]
MENIDKLAGWITVSLINANIAQIKGKNGLGYFIVSLFLGPLVTFYLCAFVDTLRNVEEKK